MFGSGDLKIFLFLFLLLIIGGGGTWDTALAASNNSVKINNYFEKIKEDEKDFSTPKIKKSYFFRTSLNPRYYFFTRFLKGRPAQFKNYNKVGNKILFLGDKESSINYSKATRLAPLLPLAQVYKTDIEVTKEEEGTFGNLIVKQVDHSTPLPFSANLFDVIVMNNGICHCSGGESTCGGLSVEVSDMTRFMSEIYRVLNKDNPKGQAILHGYNYYGKPMVEILEKSALELMKKYPDIQVEVIYSSALKLNSSVVLGVKIYPKIKKRKPLFWWKKNKNGEN